MILYNLLVFFCFIYSTYSSYSTYFTNYCVCLDLRHLLLSGSARRVQPSGAAVVGHAPTHHGASSVLLGMNIAVFDQSLFTLHQLFLDGILDPYNPLQLTYPLKDFVVDCPWPRCRCRAPQSPRDRQTSSSLRRASKQPERPKMATFMVWKCHLHHWNTTKSLLNPIIIIILPRKDPCMSLGILQVLLIAMRWKVYS
jgi:hypothetical protein